MKKGLAQTANPFFTFQPRLSQQTDTKVESK
jgi:hypothetical protein